MGKIYELFDIDVCNLHKQGSGSIEFFHICTILITYARIIHNNS